MLAKTAKRAELKVRLTNGTGMCNRPSLRHILAWLHPLSLRALGTGLHTEVIHMLNIAVLESSMTPLKHQKALAA